MPSRRVVESPYVYRVYEFCTARGGAVIDGNLCVKAIGGKAQIAIGLQFGSDGLVLPGGGKGT
jgi:hypothetical protein